jgi:hypothetical protein
MPLVVMRSLCFESADRNALKKVANSQSLSSSSSNDNNNTLFFARYAKRWFVERIANFVIAHASRNCDITKGVSLS